MPKTSYGRLVLLTVAVVTVCASGWFASTYRTATPPTVATTTTTTVLATVPPSTTADVTPTPSKVPDLVPTEWKCPEWIPVLRYVGFTGADLVTADRVLWAESRCDNTAVNAVDCWCGFQIHRPSWKAHLRDAGVVPEWEAITTDRVLCAAAAYFISTRYGWTQWSTY